MLLFLRVVVLLFGLFEFINNIKYLKMKDGITKAYDQHFEIPSTVSKEVMKKKVITMLCVGVMFLTSFGLTFIFKDNIKTIISATFIIYLIYVWGETLYYKTHAKAYALAVLISVLTALSIFVA